MRFTAKFAVLVVREGFSLAELQKVESECLEVVEDGAVRVNMIEEGEREIDTVPGSWVFAVVGIAILEEFIKVLDGVASGELFERRSRPRGIAKLPS